jgi:hypothetical protein
MNSDGSSKEMIREFVGLLTGIEVAPDGRTLLLEIMETDAYTTDLFIFRLDTEVLTGITTGKGSDFAGSWRQH